MKKKIVTIFFLVMGQFPFTGLASPLLFVPRFYEYYGQLSLDAAYNSIETATNKVQDNQFARQTFRESIILAGKGYVYHPNLLLFSIAGTGGVNQGILDVTTPTGNFTIEDKAAFEEYEARGEMFRHKPYDLTFFIDQNKPFLTARVDDETSSDRKAGGDFSYSSKNFKYRFNYMSRQDNAETQTHLSDDANIYFNYRGNPWGVENFQLSGTADYITHSTLRNGVDISPSESVSAGFTNYITHQNISSAGGMTASMKEYGSSTTKSVYLNENFSFDMPWNLTARATASLGQSSLENESFNNAGFTSKSRNQNFSGTLTQKLFLSVISNLHGGFSRNTSSSSARNSKYYSIGSAYKKNLPKNSAIRANITNAVTYTEESGFASREDAFAVKVDGTGKFLLDHRADVKDESDLSVVEVYIKLDKANIQDSINESISCAQIGSQEKMKLSSCWENERYGWLPLAATDYSVDVSAQPFEVTIKDLKNFFGKDPNDPAGVKDIIDLVNPAKLFFRVKYKLKEAFYTVASNRSELGFGLTMFSMLSGEYSHSVSFQEAVDGTAPYAFDDQISIDNFSLNFNRSPFDASVNYTWTQSATEKKNMGGIISFDKNIKLPKGINTKWKFKYSVKQEDSNFHNGISMSQDEELGTASFAASFLLPYLKAAVALNSDYIYTRGEILNLTLNSDGILQQESSSGDKGRDIFTNAINISRQFKIPKINFWGTAWGKYSWNRVTGIYEDALYTDFSWGLQSGRSWVFGATTFNMNLDYKAHLLNNENFKAQTVGEKYNSNSSIHVNMKRLFF